MIDSESMPKAQLWYKLLTDPEFNDPNLPPITFKLQADPGVSCD